MSILAHVGQSLHNVYDGLVHPFAGVDHLLAMVSIGVLAALSTTKRVAWLTPAAFVGGMILGGAVGVMGLTIPSLDAFIAASVVVLGVFVMLRPAADARWLPVIALAFGALHGTAHGAEAPLATNPFAYIAGFVVATALLHAGGAIGGWAVRRVALMRIAAGTIVSGAGLVLLVGS